MATVTAPAESNLFNLAKEAVIERNATEFKEAWSDADLIMRVIFLVGACFFVPCLLHLFCNILSCTVLLPAYLAFVRVHEPTLLGIDEPRSDADGLAPTHETPRMRYETMLRRRAEAGERLGRRFKALIGCVPYEDIQWSTP